MITEVSDARAWGLREGDLRGFKGSRGIREGVRGTRDGWEGLGACHCLPLPWSACTVAFAFYVKGGLGHG